VRTGAAAEPEVVVARRDRGHVVWAPRRHCRGPAARPCKLIAVIKLALSQASVNAHPFVPPPRVLVNDPVAAFHPRSRIVGAKRWSAMTMAGGDLLFLSHEHLGVIFRRRA
jgi:hypothetical protein